MVEVITIGEPLALFASTDLNENLAHSSHFKKYLAGAEVNFAIGTKRLGHSVEYLSQIGKDPLGDFIINEMRKNNIQTSLLQQTENFPTGIEFKNLTNHGDPETFYIRKNSATANISLDFIKNFNFDGVKLAHLTGIFPALSKNTYLITKELIQILLQKQISICFDPNLRPSLWPNTDEMRNKINEITKFATIFLPGIKEAKLLTGLSNVNEIMQYYFDNNPRMRLLVMKDGSNGAYIKTRNDFTDFIPSFKVNKVVDTVGAGDGFALGLITALLENKSIPDAVTRANAVGALAIQSQGDNTGYPTPKELNDFLRENKASNLVTQGE